MNTLKFLSKYEFLIKNNNKEIIILIERERKTTLHLANGQLDIYQL